MVLAVNPMGHSKSKHIDIQYHFVQKQLAQGIISLSYIPTSNMATDSLTKALPKNLFHKLMRHLSFYQVDKQIDTSSQDTSGSNEGIWSRGGVTCADR